MFTSRVKRGGEAMDAARQQGLSWGKGVFTSKAHTQIYMVNNNGAVGSKPPTSDVVYKTKTNEKHDDRAQDEV